MEASSADSGAARQEAVLSREEVDIAFSRVVAFTDGVFAIAITLLVLALEIPESSSTFGDELLEQQDDFFAYLLSFAVLGKLWISHHRFFAGLARFDGPLMALNFVYLAGIALLPFSSEVLGDYSDKTGAVVLYSANLAAISGTFYVQIVYAFRRKLIREKWRVYERRFAGPANFVITGLFLVSIPVAFVSTTAATLVWVATFAFGRRTVDRITGFKGIPGQP